MRSLPELALAQQLSRYVANFASTDDPNGEGNGTGARSPALPHWPPCAEGAGGTTMVLDIQAAAAGGGDVGSHAVESMRSEACAPTPPMRLAPQWPCLCCAGLVS